MKKIVMALTLCAVIALSGCTPKEAEVSQADLLIEAYQYVFPLLVMDQTRIKSTSTMEITAQKAPENAFIHANKLADATTKNVVSPNVDTIYSQAFLDLTDEPLVLTLPQTDRYFSVELLDDYTNSVTILGSGGDGNEKERQYLLAGPDTKAETPSDMKRIDLPTNRVWLLGRIAVESVEDMQNVAALQEKMSLLPLANYESGVAWTPGINNQQPTVESELPPFETVMAMEVGPYFSRAAELMTLNGPTPAADIDFLKRLEPLGELGSIDENTLADAGITWAELKEQAMTKAAADAERFSVKMGGWEYPGDPIAEFGSEYGYRAAAAAEGLGANPTSVAIYPRVETDSTDQKLSGESSYRIHFAKDALPPVQENGFWSITAYGDDNYLIDNPLNRYIINTHSKLKYNDDGSLDILVQATQPADETMVGNWLPVKAAGFHLFLRIYLPQEEVLDGSWQAPEVIKN